MAFYFYPHAISKTDCKEILDYCLGEAVFETATVYEDSVSVKDTVRSTSVCFIPRNDQFGINKMVWGYLENANTNHFHYDLNEFEPIQFAKYEVGDYYNWHIDNGMKTEAGWPVRKLSLTIPLNDDYDGGQFSFFNGDKPCEYPSFPNFEKDVQSAGSVLVFDSSDWHRVNPVTKGIRYSLVCWTKGPAFI